MMKKRISALLLSLFMLVTAMPVLSVEANEEKWVWPVSGHKMSQCYKSERYVGLRKRHHAIDISAPEGTPVVAALDGEVICANYSYTGQHDNHSVNCPVCQLGCKPNYNPGNHVWLKHSDKLYTLYLHLAHPRGHQQYPKVSKGQKVKAGDKIGLVGNTSYSEGNHLHFSIYSNISIFANDTKHFDPLETARLDLFKDITATETENDIVISFSLYNQYDPLVYGVEFGTSEDQLNHKKEKKNGEWNLISGGKIKIPKDQLKPGTQYFYRLYYTTPYNRYNNRVGKYYSKVHSFGKFIKGPICIPPPDMIELITDLSGQVNENHQLVLQWQTKYPVSPESVEIYVSDNPHHPNPTLPLAISYSFQRSCPPETTLHSHTTTQAFYDIGVPYQFIIIMVINGQRYESKISSFTNNNRASFANFYSDFFADAELREEGDFIFKVKSRAAFLIDLKEGAWEKYYYNPPDRLTLPKTCGTNQVVGVGGNLAINTIARTIDVPAGYRVLDCGMYYTDGIILRTLNLPASLCYLRGQFLSGVSHVGFAVGNPYYAVQGKNIIDMETNVIIAGSSTEMLPGSDRIENSAYSHQNIPYMVIPGSIKIIGDGAFTWLRGDNEIIISPGTTTIGRHAFSFVDGSLKLTIPESVTSIHQDALSHNYDILLIVTKGSVAESFAKDKKIPYVYKDK